MSKRGTLPTLKDILEAVVRIKLYVGSMDLDEFMEDTQKQDAVIRNFEIIGEAVKNIPTEFRRKHKDIEWNQIAGFRDRLIHQYFGVNRIIVWDVIKNKLPKLESQIKTILKTFDKKKKHKN